MTVQLKSSVATESQPNYPVLLALPMQLVFVGTVVAGDLFLSGRFGPVLPALALFVGGYFGFRRLSTVNGMLLDHRLIRRAGVISAVGMWLLSIGLYSWIVVQNPEEVGYSLGMLWFFAPIVSLAPAVGGLVMTLCSGEMAAMLCEDSPVAKMVTRGDPFVRDDESCSPCCPSD